MVKSTISRSLSPILWICHKLNKFPKNCTSYDSKYSLASVLTFKACVLPLWKQRRELYDIELCHWCLIHVIEPVKTAYTFLKLMLPW